MLTDKQKVDVVITKITEKFNSQREMPWDDFKAFLGAITKAKIKVFVKAALADEQTKMTGEAGTLNTKVADYDTLRMEVDGL